ncbi:PepSY domain-containing protein [Natribacillus halophilus]|uniref:Predicted small secreted protein n=1 Tax=Natribacillus halophilus TaxID=549003 RepID=A0A1G8NI60_9BACI|nr:PepSY domain-containing protein [Natribacillus halophilus]SDI79190.1 Predicted small secreted protein [Natribacillus halophilus]
MKIRDLVIGVTVGFAAGYAVKEACTSKSVSPEKALKEVKSNVQNKIPVNGSWIHMNPEHYEKNDLDYDVYRGGLSSHEDGQTKQHDFVVDAKTGTILELDKQR